MRRAQLAFFLSLSSAVVVGCCRPGPIARQVCHDVTLLSQPIPHGSLLKANEVLAQRRLHLGPDTPIHDESEEPALPTAGATGILWELLIRDLYAVGGWRVVSARHSVSLCGTAPVRTHREVDFLLRDLLKARHVFEQTGSLPMMHDLPPAMASAESSQGG